MLKSFVVMVIDIQMFIFSMGTRERRGERGRGTYFTVVTELTVAISLHKLWDIRYDNQIMRWYPTHSISPEIDIPTPPPPPRPLTPTSRIYTLPSTNAP